MRLRPRLQRETLSQKKNKKQTNQPKRLPLILPIKNTTYIHTHVEYTHNKYVFLKKKIKWIVRASLQEYTCSKSVLLGHMSKMGTSGTIAKPKCLREKVSCPQTGFYHKREKSY